MYKVLVADDNPSIRAGMCVLIDWNQYGFEVPLLASNGQEALKTLKDQDVQLLIVDVRMPIMDGIELLRQVSHLGLPVKSIVLSAYQDFGYAQSAMEYRALRYLLKPINEEKLIEAVSAVRQELDDASGITDADNFTALVEYMHGHLKEKLSLKDLSAQFHYNSAYLGRLMSKRLNMNFNDYLCACRMEKAEKLLEKTFLSINEVAAEVGYTNVNRFTQAFRARNGKSPTAWRKQAGKNKES